MVTNQLMKRDFNNAKITQRTKDSFFNATELLQYYNRLANSNKRFKDFWENNNTKEFIIALENELLTNRDNSAHLQVLETTRGNKGSTWMHPYLFVKFAFWLSPEFEVKIIKWVYDNLIIFRNQAGDYYKQMCSVISETYQSWFGKTPDPLIYIKEAKYLNLLVFENESGNQRNRASEIELSLMNQLQLLNINLCRQGLPIRHRRDLLLNYANTYKNIENVKLGIMRLTPKELQKINNN